MHHRHISSPFYWVWLACCLIKSLLWTSTFLRCHNSRKSFHLLWHVCLSFFWDKLFIACQNKHHKEKLLMSAPNRGLFSLSLLMFPYGSLFLISFQVHFPLLSLHKTWLTSYVPSPFKTQKFYTRGANSNTGFKCQTCRTFTYIAVFPYHLLKHQCSVKLLLYILPTPHHIC